MKRFYDKWVTSQADNHKSIDGNVDEEFYYNTSTLCMEMIAEWF